MPRTRSAAPSQASEPVASQQTPQLKAAEKPSRTFILPSNTSAAARLLSLPNPQSNAISPYFFCPGRGLYEFTTVVAPPLAPRSILFTSKKHSLHEPDAQDTAAPATASIAKKAELLVATPIDVAFFLVGLLSPSAKSGQSLYQPLDDIIDSHDDLHSHFRHVLYNDSFRRILLARAEAICDFVEAGDEKMFRFSESKLLKELLVKAERMADQGLPASLEDRFVRQALAAPLMSVKCVDDMTNQGDKNSSAGTGEASDTPDSPATLATTATPSISTPPGETTPVPVPSNDDSDEIRRLQRISIALSFMKESYLSTAMSSRIDELLISPDSPLNLGPLTDRLKELTALRAEAAASRGLSDFSRKRGLDDEEAEDRADKKRKKQEEEKKAKASLSRGVRDLQKVNTTGMKKMSDFFGKAAAKKKT
ncbi:Uncharacterized protein PECH_008336 [Penicillium ucsense]|uniref:Ribonuclease H2 subunit B n=1 Tax=Penicillium ucsense TaxID=2839758 RepID=A0A8J8WHL8_9EURO|nr:Uncharacterized protein PECM_008154 [Penicillium ucsense]KAF7734235.1 Uncharacterized protein PECH_008336 [Penicillium ucsense]